MTTKTTNRFPSLVYGTLGGALSESIPDLMRVFADESNFRGISLRARDDGTTLAVCRTCAGDGTPVVYFGSGYGIVGALLAVDATVRAGKWKKDRFATS